MADERDHGPASHLSAAGAWPAVLPAVAVAAAFGLVEAVGGHRLLFTSLASTALIVAADRRPARRAVGEAALTQAAAVAAGFLAAATLGPGYAAAAAALVAVCGAMAGAAAVHPPAASTAALFAFRPADPADVGLFGLALGVAIAVAALPRLARRAGPPR